MKEEELIKKLENTVLPGIEVQSHRLRLRTALLNSEYFKEQAEGGVFSLAKSKIKGGVEMATKVWKPAAIGVLASAVIFAVLFLMPIQFPGGPVSAEKGEVVFAITDAAANMGDVSSVNVTIDSIEVHSEGSGWVTLASDVGTYDLLELKAKGTTELLVQAELKVGTYDQVRLNISKVVVVDGSGSCEAKLPSNKLQLKGNFTVNSGTVTTITFDFVADQSLHITGEGRYIFAPVIQLETRSNPEVQINANNQVQISGGQVMTHVQVGMDTKGNMDSGLLISPDAVLRIDASGKVVQVKGKAFATGTITAIDVPAQVVTITTETEGDITLKVVSGTQLRVDGTIPTLATLATKIASRVTVEYDVNIKVAASITVQAQASVTAMGTIKAVAPSAGTITITTNTGTDIVLNVTSATRIEVNGTIPTLATLATKIGLRVTVEYDAQTNTAISINVQQQELPQ